MHIKDIETLRQLVEAIESDRVDEYFPPDAQGSVHAIYLGFKELYRQRQPGHAAAHPALCEKTLVDALDGWPMKDLLNFIKVKGNDLPKLVHEQLLGMIDTTAALGADAVLYLTDLEITLSKKRGVPPREELVTHFISSYGGRISLLRGLTTILVEHFPKSESIDAALARHVPVHRMARREFDDVATSSDLMMAVHYPRTLKACVECLAEENSEHKFQFFRDHANGRMPAWALSIYTDVLGHDQCLEQAGLCLRGSYRAAMDGFEEPFERFVDLFGATELLNTQAMREDLEMDEQKGVVSSFFKWYVHRMPYDVPEYTELAIPLVPSMILEDGKLPCSGFLIAWKNSREPEMFLAEFLESLSHRQTKKPAAFGSTNKFRDFEKLLPAFDENITRHSIAALVHGAFAPGAGLNEIALSIKSALVLAGVPAIAGVLPDLSSTALHGLCKQFGHQHHKELMRFYPKVSEFVMAVDLGL